MKSVRRLLSEYLTSVGHGCTLILNLNPDTRGLVPEEDRKAYEKLGVLKVDEKSNLVLVYSELTRTTTKTVTKLLVLSFDK